MVNEIKSIIFSVIKAKIIVLYKIDTIPPISVLYVGPSLLKFKFIKWPNESAYFINFDILYILIQINFYINLLILMTEINVL